MSDLGGIGVAIPSLLKVANYGYGRFATAVVSGSGAGGGSKVVAFLRARPVADAVADNSGNWIIDGLDNGTYWASEIGTVRGWLVTVSGATVTVVEQDPPDSGDVINAGYSFASIG